MRIVELLGPEECPCGSGKSVRDCFIPHQRPSEVFPDQRGGQEGLLIKFFAVFRADGTTAIVMPKQSFRLYVHAQLDMELLDKYLIGEAGDIPPPEIQKHFDTIDELSNERNKDTPVILTNTYHGYKFTGKKEDLANILKQVWFVLPFMWEDCVRDVLNNKPHTSAFHKTQLQYCLNFISEWGRWGHVVCPSPKETPAKLKQELNELCPRKKNLRWVFSASVQKHPNGLQKLVVKRLSNKFEEMPVVWFLVHCFRTMVWAEEYGLVHDELTECLHNIITARTNKPLIYFFECVEAGHFDNIST